MQTSFASYFACLALVVCLTSQNVAALPAHRYERQRHVAAKRFVHRDSLEASSLLSRFIRSFNANPKLANTAEPVLLVQVQPASVASVPASDLFVKLDARHEEKRALNKARRQVFNEVFKSESDVMVQFGSHTINIEDLPTVTATVVNTLIPSAVVSSIGSSVITEVAYVLAPASSSGSRSFSAVSSIATSRRRRRRSSAAPSASASSSHSASRSLRSSLSALQSTSTLAAEPTISARPIKLVSFEVQDELESVSDSIFSSLPASEGVFAPNPSAPQPFSTTSTTESATETSSVARRSRSSVTNSKRPSSTASASMSGASFMPNAARFASASHLSGSMSASQVVA